ncbi:hypothetical protein ACHAPT_010218 [Fusarium lateritium]
MKLTYWTFFFTSFATAGSIAGFKSDPVTVDVAIIGGGATGAYAAVRLREDYNKSILVIEKANRLVGPTLRSTTMRRLANAPQGGHAHAYQPPNSQRAINYGVQAYLNREATAAFFNRFGVGLVDPELDSLPQRTSLDFNTGMSVDIGGGGGGVDASTVAALLAKYGDLATKYQPWFENGYFQTSKVPKDLLLPFGEFLTKHGLQGSLIILRTLLWLSDALNTPTWFVLAVAGQPQLSALGFGAPGPSFKWPETYSSETLFDRVQHLLGRDVLLRSTVVSSKRTNRGVNLVVQTPSGPRIVKAKKLLISAPPSPRNFGTWDLDKNEKSLLSKFSWEALYVGVVNNTGLPANMTSISNTPDNPSDLYLPRGNFVDAFERAGVHQDASQDLWVTRVIGQPGLTAREAQTLIEKALNRIRANLTYDVAKPSIIAFASHGPTVPKVSARDLKGGFFNKLFALQGQRSTFWTGLAWAPDYTPILWDFTERLFPRILEGLE